MDPALGAPFSRYEVNVLVTCEDATCGAPIVEELHPTLGNLIGRIEYMARQGALVTNFRLIKPGAVHRANGGYLLLDARSLLTEALSWTALKRMLKQRRIVIEEPSRIMGLGSTVTLEPDPIPLDVKIVLFGDRLLYYLLSAFDPELREHFKVLADFEDDIDRGEESEAAMARLLAALVKDEELLPIEREGVALLIEHAARMADDAGRRPCWQTGCVISSSRRISRRAKPGTRLRHAMISGTPSMNGSAARRVCATALRKRS